MLTTRCRQPEVMDDPLLEMSEHTAALMGLQRIHALSGTLGRMWRPIKKLIDTQQLRQLRVLDVGCGDSLLLRQLYHRAAKRGCSLHVIGCDFSERALELSELACQRERVPIELHHIDVTKQPLPTTADVVINSLFLHHFEVGDVLRILELMSAAGNRLVLIEDLLRSRLGFVLCWGGVRLLTRSRVVHIDGPLSVRAAFTLPEIRDLLYRAGWTDAYAAACWPQRFLIHYQPQSAGVHRAPSIL